MSIKIFNWRYNAVSNPEWLTRMKYLVLVTSHFTQAVPYSAAVWWSRPVFSCISVMVMIMIMLLCSLMTTEHVSVKSGKRCHASQANTGWRRRKRSVGLNSCNLHWPSQTRSFLLCPALTLSPFPWINLLPVQTLTRYPATGLHLSFHFSLLESVVRQCAVYLWMFTTVFTFK